MAYEQREGSGSIFVNKKTKDSQPDWTGEAKYKGELLRVSLWIKEGRNGNWFSMSIQPKQAGGARPPTGGRNDPRPPVDDDEFGDSSIPF